MNEQRQKWGVHSQIDIENWKVAVLKKRGRVAEEKPELNLRSPTFSKVEPRTAATERATAVGKKSQNIRTGLHIREGTALGSQSNGRHGTAACFRSLLFCLTKGQSL